MTIVTNIGRPLVDPARKGRGNAQLTYTLNDSDGQRVERFALDGQGEVTIGEVTVGLDAAGEHSIELVPNEGIEDSHYLVQLQDGRSRRQWRIQVPDSTTPVDFWELVAAGRPLTAAEYSALQVHISDDDRHMQPGDREAIAAIETFTLYAGETLGGDKALVLVGGVAMLADQATTAAGAVIGFSAGAATQGELVTIRRSGLAGISGLAQDAIYYLGSAGAVTATPPATGLLQSLGVAQSTNQLSIHLGAPYVRTA